MGLRETGSWVYMPEASTASSLMSFYPKVSRVKVSESRCAVGKEEQDSNAKSQRPPHAQASSEIQSFLNAVNGRNLRKATGLKNSDETRNQREVSEAAAIMPVQRCRKEISLGSHPATEMGGRPQSSGIRMLRSQR